MMIFNTGLLRIR